jgi:RNA exonuclease 4
VAPVGDVPEFRGWTSWSFRTEATVRALEVMRKKAPIASIDVECVATGTKWNDRTPGQIGLAKGSEESVPSQKCWYIKPESEVKSYLTPLTGLDAELIESKGLPQEEALTGVRAFLGASTVLVGQNISQDIKWLGLEEGVDYAATVDLAHCLQFYSPGENRYRVFSLEHTAKTWLGEEYSEGRPHDAATDAEWSIRLFEYFCSLVLEQKWALLQELEHKTLTTTPKVPFARKHPIYEGCEVRKPDPKRAAQASQESTLRVEVPSAPPAG